MNMDRRNVRAAAKLVRIENVAKELNISVREIRFYQKRGLLSKLAEGASIFVTARDADRLKVILAGKKAGFKLSEMKKFLGGKRIHKLKQFEAHFTVETCLCQIRELEQKRQEMGKVIRELEHTCSALNEWQATIPAEKNPNIVLSEKFGL